MLKKLIILSSLTLSAVSFCKSADAGPRDGQGRWVTKCYHHNVSNSGDILDTAYLGELAIAFIQCEDNPFLVDRIHQHHTTGLVTEEDGTESFKPPFISDHDNPNCVIDSTLVWDPGY